MDRFTRWYRRFIDIEGPSALAQTLSRISGKGDRRWVCTGLPFDDRLKSRFTYRALEIAQIIS